MSWENIHNFVNGQSQQFTLQLKQPEQSQSNFLIKLIESNRDSEFGLHHNFKSISSIKAYQKNVPIQSYSDIENEITRMTRGEDNILCSEQVTSFERTGGSSGGNKYIPYTRSSLDSFHSALYPWLDDLLTNRPGIKNGTVYWSISPSLKDESYKTSHSSENLSNDAHYFGTDIAQEFSKLIVIPESISQLNDHENWQYFTLRYLIAANDLAFISVWSPTFLIDLMTYLFKNHEQMCSDIKHGLMSVKANEYSQHQHPSLLTPDPVRAGEVLQACSKRSMNGSMLWPKLDTISCWHDATSKQYIPQLKNIFSNVYFQAKGLMATEGVISTPLCDHNAAVLATNSCFFEFMDSSGNIYLAHELNMEGVYDVIISNYSGLYRYRIGDRVKVTGFVEHTPSVKFIGRHGITSDLCGEKLTEAFVQQQIDSTDGFIMLMPQAKENRGYLLIIDASQYNAKDANKLAAEIDHKLLKNPQYAYARKLNQLAPLIALRSMDPWKKYITHESSRGRKIGDIKPCSLYTDDDFLKLIVSDSRAT